MAFYECKVGGSGGGIPPQLQSDMDSVFNKKLGTSTTYPSNSWAKEVNLMGLLPEKTVSGSVASFPDGADDVPIKTATFNIAPTLVGVSAVNVVRTGKNIADFSDVTISAASYVLNNLDVFCPTGKVTLSFDFTGTGSSTSLRFDDKDGNSVGVTAKNITEGRNEIVVTLSADAYKIKFYSNAIGAFSDFQLEIGNGATTYAPYSAITRTISLGQTVYGGSVTVDEDGNCDLESTYCTPIDLGSLDWTFYSNAAYPYMMANISGYKWVNNNPNVECEGYNFASIGSSGNAEGFFITNTNIIRIRDLNYQTAESLTDFKAHVTGLKLSYGVTTPTESDIDPITPINTLLGVNNIWCDTGDVETLTYRQSNALPTEQVLTDGQVSTESEYATANFTKSVDGFDMVTIRLKDTVNGTDYEDIQSFKVSKIGSGLQVYFNLHVSITCNLTKTSISSTQYGGAYYNIYADVVAFSDSIFDN